MEGKGICETDPTSEERKMRARGISAGDEKFLTKLKKVGSGSGTGWVVWGMQKGRL